MEIWVFDSTPLIHFAKTGLIDQIAKLQIKRIIPKSVYFEVVETGLKLGKSDAQIIKRFVESEKFVIQSARKNKFYENLLNIRGLHKADSEALALAKELGARVIIDEHLGRTIAEQEGIKMGSSLFILFRLLRLNELNKTEFRECLDRMILKGWYCSISLYSQILKELEEFE